MKKINKEQMSNVSGGLLCIIHGALFMFSPFFTSPATVIMVCWNNQLKPRTLNHIDY